MATDLFSTFDAALGKPHIPLGVRVQRWIDGVAAARRRDRLARSLQELPPHLLDDIGMIHWDGRLWRQHDQMPLFTGPGRAQSAISLDRGMRPIAG